MTERERWIVYPLLFLALGASLRDKLVDRDGNKRIVCQELTITDGESDGQYPPRIYAQLGRTDATANSPSHGYLLVNGEVGVNGIVSVNGAVNAGQYLHLIPRGQQRPGVPAPARSAMPMRAEPREADKQPPPSAPAVSPDSSSTESPSKSNTPELPTKD